MEKPVEPTVQEYCGRCSVPVKLGEGFCVECHRITDGGKPNTTTPIIKDSGERAKFASGMVRDITGDKVRYDLILPESQPLPETMLYRWARQLTLGAKKYSTRNWEIAAGPEELARFRESAFRHFMQWYAGETDEDHAAAVFFNINGAEYVKGRMK